MRSRGIFAFKEIPLETAELTCLRYGWPTSKLVPVGPRGTSHPCRGRSSSDNHPRNYYAISDVTDIEECKAICAAWTGLPRDNHPRNYYAISDVTDIEECKAICAAWTGLPRDEWGCGPKCSGIEWSYGRCELWKVEIGSVNPNVDGFTCLKFDMIA